METYKVVVLGAGGVGKSALTIQLVLGRFVSAYDPTIEDFYKKTISVDGKDTTLDILDTAGQDDFAAIRATYMRNGQGFILVFAVNDGFSFDAIDKFQRDVKITCRKDDIPIIVCGNKCDVEDRKFTQEEAFCSSNDLKYYETSAKTNQNILEAFSELTRQMRKRYNADVPPENVKNIDNTNACCNIF